VICCDFSDELSSNRFLKYDFFSPPSSDDAPRMDRQVPKNYQFEDLPAWFRDCQKQKIRRPSMRDQLDAPIL